MYPLGEDRHRRFGNRKTGIGVSVDRGRGLSGFLSRPDEMMVSKPGVISTTPVEDERIDQQGEVKYSWDAD